MWNIEEEKRELESIWEDDHLKEKEKMKIKFINGKKSAIGKLLPEKTKRKL